MLCAERCAEAALKQGRSCYYTTTAAAATHHDMPGIFKRRMNAFLFCDNDQSCIEQGHHLYAVRTRDSTAVQNPRASQRAAVLGF
jgi:hypothetical protein